MKRLRVFFLILGGLSLSLSAFLFGLYKGFDYRLLENSEGAFGESGYGFLARCYFSICFWLVVHLLLRLMRPGVVSLILSVAALSLVFISYRLIYLQKTLFFEDAQSGVEFLQMATPIDLVNFSLIVSLMASQIMLFINDRRSKHDRVA